MARGLLLLDPLNLRVTLLELAFNRELASPPRWLRSEQRDNVFMVATDDSSHDYLQQHYHGHVQSLVLFMSLLDNPENYVVTEQFAEFGGAEFARLTCVRPLFLSVILSQGFNVLWVDSDAVLSRNPFDILLVAYDYIGADDNSSGNEQDSDNACS